MNEQDKSLPQAEEESPSDELVDSVLAMVDEVAEQRGYTKAEKDTFLQRIVDEVNIKIKQLEGEKAMRQLLDSIPSFFQDYYRQLSGQENPDSDWITQQQVGALQSESMYVLWHIDEEGYAYLDEDYILGMLAVLMEAVNKEELDTRAALLILDDFRRRFIFDAKKPSLTGWFYHTPPYEMLAGEHGEERARAFTAGALDFTAHALQAAVKQEDPRSS